MATIHPTAIVDPRAELADDAQVGPGCIVEGLVRIGPGSRLIANVYLRGPVSIGAANTIYPFACVGFEPQHQHYDTAHEGPGVVIGDHNRLREGVTIHSATGPRATSVGDRNFLMANSHVGHDAAVHNDCTLANGALLGGHVEVGDFAVLGGNAAVHQFCRLGRLSMVAGTHGVAQDVPPFCIAYTTRRVGSLNLVGLRRSRYRQHIEPLKRAFDALYRQRLANMAAVELIEEELKDDPLCLELARFVRETKRGITQYGSSDKVEAEAKVTL